MEDFKINEKNKDRLFRFLFGNAEYKDNALSLYNAVNGTDYKNVDDITFYTIDDIIYIHMKNDVAILFNSSLSLWEHQSTYNPNMPLRGLIYFGSMYGKYIKQNHKNIYGESLIKIPCPKYCVFYNGTKDRPAVEKIRLSSAFESKDDSGDFEWTATMYNLNSGKNEELLRKCRVLSEYMSFVNAVRKNYEEGMDAEVAVDRAVTECIQNGILADYLRGHRAEVIAMILTEFDEEAYRKGIFEEGHKEGLEQGIEQGLSQGRLEILLSLVKDGSLTVEKASAKLSISVEEFEKMMSDN